ncbi:MAG: hypothetical protein R3B84_13485 [Zavarzinella sp.]
MPPDSGPGRQIGHRWIIAELVVVGRTEKGVLLAGDQVQRDHWHFVQLQPDRGLPAREAKKHLIAGVHYYWWTDSPPADHCTSFLYGCLRNRCTSRCGVQF